jgi:WD40 repeat protein
VLKACDVETGIVKISEGQSYEINCVDISVNSKLLASGTDDFTARMWNLDTAKLVAGSFASAGWANEVQFLMDS